MTSIYSVNKPVGFTPKQILDYFRLKMKFSDDIKLTYQGRLDPMAEGVMLIIARPVPETIQQCKAFNKTYITEALLGITTDSYDLLGLPGEIKRVDLEIKAQVEQWIENLKNKRTQLLPPFSSKKIAGKALWEWTKLGEIKPDFHRDIQIFNTQVISFHNFELNELKGKIDLISKIPGDFRQEQIIAAWKQIIDQRQETLPLLTIKIKCSSGTYIRSLINELGEALGCGAVTVSIKRTQTGPYKINDALQIV